MNQLFIDCTCQKNKQTNVIRGTLQVSPSYVRKFAVEKGCLRLNVLRVRDVLFDSKIFRVQSFRSCMQSFRSCNVW